MRRGVTRLIAEERCRTGKAIYLSYDHAVMSIRAFKRSGRGKQGGLHPYRCPICRSWHVGAPTRNPTKKKQKVGV